ncbi:MAG TPA: DUF4365 domain-containing protein [Phycisphaerae bacterium]|nr:DUF4365 domain-containing protein [Phycisphaerae bacterium]
MTPKELSRAAYRIFVGAIPPNLAIRSQEDQEDYGVDYEVELTTNQDEATGYIFKIQQKGAHTLRRMNDGKTVILEKFPIAKLTYYLRELRIPILLVAVEISSRTVFWCQLQGNPGVESAYANALRRGRQTISLHICASNALPQTFDDFMIAVRQSSDWLLVTGMIDTPTHNFTAAALRGDKLDDAVSRVRDHLDSLKCEQLELLIQNKKRKEALDQARLLLESKTETPAIRIAAGINITRIAGSAEAEAGEPADSGQYLRFRIAMMLRLLRIVRTTPTPRRLRLYVRCMLRSARLAFFVNRATALSMSLRIQKQTGNDFTRHITEAQRQPLTRLLLRELRLCANLVGVAIEDSCCEVVPQLWAYAVNDIANYVLELREVASDEAAARLESWLDYRTAISVEIAALLKNWNDLILCSLAYMRTANPRDVLHRNRRFATAVSFLKRIADRDMREKSLATLDEYKHGLEEVLKRSPTIDDDVSMYRELAASLGVNLADPNDEIAQIINIGLRDLNPERVVKKCRYFYVSIGVSGVPAQMIGLPTAGSKFLHCTRHNFTMMGYSLDDIYGWFESQHCSKCRDCEPLPPDWSWTLEWQEEQDKIHKSFANRKYQL